MKWTIHFLFFLLFLVEVNLSFSQSRIWIEDSAKYSPPRPSIGWDSLESLIIYPEIYNCAGVEQSQSIVVFISLQGKIDSIDHRKMYQLLIQFVDSAMYSTKWIPGKFKGVPIDTSITIPISFKLYNSEDAPPININSARKLERGHWEYLPVFIDTSLVRIPPNRPKNFYFIFKWKTYPDSLYLDTSENLLVTLKGDVDTSIFFSLSESEMDTIYKKMRDIHFFCYPKDYRPGISGIMNPYFLFYCKMIAEDFENEISINTGQLSNDPSYKKMKEFLWKIYDLIHKSADYKRIRKPTLINIYE